MLLNGSYLEAAYGAKRVLLTELRIIVELKVYYLEAEGFL